MSDINIKNLEFEEWEYIFKIEMLEIRADFLIGDLKKGLSKTNEQFNEFIDKC